MTHSTAHEPRPRRAPPAVLHIGLVASSLVVLAITLASGDAATPYPLLYFLVATAAFCFLGHVGAALQAAVIVAAYGVGLVAVPPSAGSAPMRGVLFTLALCAGGASIGALRARHDRLMAEFRRVSRTDPLTGLLDQDGFEMAMANEIERAPERQPLRAHRDGGRRIRDAALRGARLGACRRWPDRGRNQARR
jgi:uncharacterized membrane protein YccC